MPAVVRLPVSRSGSPGLIARAAITSGCSRTMPRRASRAAGRRVTVSVRSSATAGPFVRVGDCRAHAIAVAATPPTRPAFTALAQPRRVSVGRMPLSTRLRRALPRLTRRRVIAGSAVLVVVAALVGWAALPDRDPWTLTDQRITVRSGPAGTEPIDL